MCCLSSQSISFYTVLAVCKKVGYVMFPKPQKRMHTKKQVPVPTYLPNPLYLREWVFSGSTDIQKHRYHTRTRILHASIKNRTGWWTFPLLCIRQVQSQNDKTVVKFTKSVGMKKPGLKQVQQYPIRYYFSDFDRCLVFKESIKTKPKLVGSCHEASPKAAKNPYNHWYPLWHLPGTPQQ